MRNALITLLSTAILVGGCATSRPTPTAADAPAPRPFMTLDAGQAMIVADRGGAMVEMRVLDTGDTLMLRDGERVVLREQLAAEGMGRAEAQILARDQLGVVPNPRVADEDRLIRRPAHGLVVFSAVRTCDAACVYEIWALHRDGWRVKVSGDAPAPAAVVAVRPDGAELAIGARGLFIVSLPDGRVQRWAEFTAPAYGPDGTLFVRGVGSDDAVYTVGEFGRGAELYGEPGTPPKGTDGRFPEPSAVTFPDGKPSASFVRGAETTTITLPAP